MTGIVFIGMPCSGKSTIAREVSKRLQLPYISSGDIARKMAEYDIGAQSRLDQGRMAPEFLMRTKIRNELLKHMHGRFILDGFPRMADQVAWLDVKFPFMDKVYVYVNCSVEDAHERMSLRGRDDDTVHNFDTRMNFFINETRKILTIVPDSDVYTIMNDSDSDIEDIIQTVVRKVRDDIL